MSISPCAAFFPTTKDLKNQGFFVVPAYLLECGLGFLFPIMVGLFGLPTLNCVAGASASSWVVVVNGDSLASRTIANYYCHARDIPARNVIVLNKVPAGDLTDVDTFREQILVPIFETINKRGLGHIQGIAYSADFPTAIDIQSDLAGIENRSPYLTPVGSINGLTYLYRFVLAKNPSYISFESNMYASQPVGRMLVSLPSTPEEQAELATLVKESKHAEIAAIFDQRCESMDPGLVFPYRYIAAQQWALAGELANAMSRIEKAIREGWYCREHIIQDPAFKKMLDDKDFQRILKRCAEEPMDCIAARGFDARSYYAANTLASSDAKLGVSYMMSMVLAVTRDLGTTQSEAIEGLMTSVRSDYTQPDGSFVFAKTGDVRTTTREPQFAMAIEKLKARGKNAFVVDGMLPPAGEACSGVMIGTPDFAWGKSGVKLLPGALAENLTSLGGAMTNASQTKLSEFIRYGAAASSGAVTEPYAIQNKFPHPMMHVNYVDGLTSAEAFYSSLLCPYQLLIVGDPLCQPFCKPPRFEIRGAKKTIGTGEPMPLELVVESAADSSDPETLQWVVDGEVRNERPFDPKVRLTFQEVAGAHEVRWVAKSDKPMEHRFEQSMWVSVGPATKQLVLSGPKTWTLASNRQLTLKVESGAENSEIKVWHDAEEIGTIATGDTTIDVSPSKVGYGPLRFQISRQGTGGRSIFSLPIVVEATK